MAKSFERHNKEALASASRACQLLYDDPVALKLLSEMVSDFSFAAHTYLALASLLKSFRGLHAEDIKEQLLCFVENEAGGELPEEDVVPGGYLQ